MVGAKRNPWGGLLQKPFPFANSPTGCTPTAFGSRHSTRGYKPLPHPGQRVDSARLKGYEKPDRGLSQNDRILQNGTTGRVNLTTDAHNR